MSVLFFILVAALITSLSVHGRSLEVKVETDTHVAKGDEAIIDIPDMTKSLLDPTEREIQLPATHSQQDWLPGNSAPAEDTREIGSGVERNRDEPEQLQTHSEGEVGDQELKTELKVVCWVVPIPAGGIISVLAGLPGNEKAVLPHKVLFKVYTFLLFSSFLSCGVVFMFIIIRPKLRGLTTVVRIVMWISLVLVTYALAFAICVLLPMSLMGLVLVLVSPVVLVGLAMVFCIMKKCN